MKKILFWLFAILYLSSGMAYAHRMVQIENYLMGSLVVSGLPDYPPFAYRTKNKYCYTFHSAYLEPLIEVAGPYNIKLQSIDICDDEPNIKRSILNLRSGESNLFIGAYSHTKLFTGLDLIYPAHVSNPIHIITLPETKDKIKTGSDLMNLRGTISKTEYLSDFVMLKIKPLNINFVESPYEAYKLLFTGKVDYIIGGMYYNKIMASRYGIEQYLAYSQKPIFKIPVFVAMSKETPKASLYKKFFSEALDNPEFSKKVKQEIIRIVEDEIVKNVGVVPPSFVDKMKKTVSEPKKEIDKYKDTGILGGKVIEDKVDEITLDEVLDGI